MISDIQHAFMWNKMNHLIGRLSSIVGVWNDLGYWISPRIQIASLNVVHHQTVTHVHTALTWQSVGPGSGPLWRGRPVGSSAAAWARGLRTEMTQAASDRSAVINNMMCGVWTQSVCEGKDTAPRCAGLHSRHRRMTDAGLHTALQGFWTRPWTPSSKNRTRRD